MTYRLTGLGADPTISVVRSGSIWSEVVFRGRQTARIDDKGRLKIPSEFRALLEQQYGARLFVTSLTGEYVRLYPMPVWEAVEARLAAMPSTHPARVKFLDLANYFGQSADLDGQGRVLIHPALRLEATMVGDVDVIGLLTYLDVWNHARYDTRVRNNPLSAEDLAALSAAGI
jgi:MraZ protein